MQKSFSPKIENLQPLRTLDYDLNEINSSEETVIGEPGSRMEVLGDDFENAAIPNLDIRKQQEALSAVRGTQRSKAHESKVQMGDIRQKLGLEDITEAYGTEELIVETAFLGSTSEGVSQDEATKFQKLERPDHEEKWRAPLENKIAQAYEYIKQNPNDLMSGMMSTTLGDLDSLLKNQNLNLLEAANRDELIDSLNEFLVIQSTREGNSSDSSTKEFKQPNNENIRDTREEDFFNDMADALEPSIINEAVDSSLDETGVFDSTKGITKELNNLEQDSGLEETGVFDSTDPKSSLETADYDSSDEYLEETGVLDAVGSFNAPDAYLDETGILDAVESLEEGTVIRQTPEVNDFNEALADLPSSIKEGNRIEFIPFHKGSHDRKIGGKEYVVEDENFESGGMSEIYMAYRKISDKKGGYEKLVVKRTGRKENIAEQTWKKIIDEPDLLKELEVKGVINIPRVLSVENLEKEQFIVTTYNGESLEEAKHQTGIDSKMELIRLYSEQGLDASSNNVLSELIRKYKSDKDSWINPDYVRLQLEDFSDVDTAISANQLNAEQRILYNKKLLNSEGFNVLADALSGSSIALSGAHKAGVAHRDVKPSNMTLDGDMIDWGIARQYNVYDNNTIYNQAAYDSDSSSYNNREEYKNFILSDPEMKARYENPIFTGTIGYMGPYAIASMRELNPRKRIGLEGPKQDNYVQLKVTLEEISKKLGYNGLINVISSHETPIDGGDVMSSLVGTVQEGPEHQHKLVQLLMMQGSLPEEAIVTLLPAYAALKRSKYDLSESENPEGKSPVEILNEITPDIDVTIDKTLKNFKNDDGGQKASDLFKLFDQMGSEILRKGLFEKLDIAENLAKFGENDSYNEEIELYTASERDEIHSMADKIKKVGTPRDLYLKRMKSNPKS